MQQVIYLSPIPLHSPTQRPHHFVKWLHHEFSTNVIWVNPYPTRLLRLSDISRLKSTHHHKRRDLAPIWHKSPWLQIYTPYAPPIEPLPCGAKFVSIFQKKIRQNLRNILKNNDNWLIVGKPSGMARELCSIRNGHNVLYDVMDDIPEFMNGFSKYWSLSIHDYLIKNSEFLWASSENIFNNLESSSIGKVKLVKNGMNIPEKNTYKNIGKKIIIGYVGTIASWFDFQLIRKIAKSNTEIDIHIYGPLEVRLPEDLPSNVLFLGPISHENIYEIMPSWHAGIIPFLKNKLTSSVDPIKYYEYRACGLPVLSTMFGEMLNHAKKDVDLWDIENIDLSTLETIIKKWHEDYKKNKKYENIPEILKKSTWSERFEEGAHFCGWYS